MTDAMITRALNIFLAGRDPFWTRDAFNLIVSWLHLLIDVSLSMRLKSKIAVVTIYGLKKSFVRTWWNLNYLYVLRNILRTCAFVWLDWLLHRTQLFRSQLNACFLDSLEKCLTDWDFSQYSGRWILKEDSGVLVWLWQYRYWVRVIRTFVSSMYYYSCISVMHISSHVNWFWAATPEIEQAGLWSAPTHPHWNSIVDVRFDSSVGCLKHLW